MRGNEAFISRRQRNIASWRGTATFLLRRFECFAVRTLSEERICKVEFHIIGVRIRAQGRLKMLDGIVIQPIASQQHAYAGLRAVIVGAELI